MRFIITNPNDFIQSHWLHNKFYEQAEMSYAKQFVPVSPVIVDVGANVGNHAIFFDKEYQASKVYVFEPNPDAYQVMLMNSALNYCHSIDFSYLGVILGDTNGVAEPNGYSADNMGDASYTVGKGTVAMVPGDSLFANIHIDLIKIDVEGMDKAVLMGFADTIKNSRPTIYIEIRDTNDAWFNEWIVNNGYSIAAVLSEYETYKNYLIVPSK
jgi:FkbM family methyltransferase